MATKWYIVLLLAIVGISLPVSFEASGVSWVGFVPLWLVAIFLAQIIAFRLFGIDVSQPSKFDEEDK